MGCNYIETPRTFCSLGGAIQTVSAISGAIPIVHASSGCGGNTYMNQMGASGILGGGWSGGMAVPSTNIIEKHVVFGGIERLKKQIETTLEIMDGSLYVVVTGCMTDIIGDDIDSVVREFKEQGVPILGASTGGFLGNGYTGYDLALTAIVNDYVEKTDVKIKNKVNLLGIVPAQDPFWRGNITLLRELLESIGLEVNSFFTEKDTLENIKNSGSADLNIVVSEYYGIGTARAYQAAHSIPYVSVGFPIGVTAAAELIRKIVDALELDKEKTQRILEAQVKEYYAYMDRAADGYNDYDLQRYAIVAGDANYAPGITRFLSEELGWLPEITFVTDTLKQPDKEKLSAQLSKLENYKTKLIFETDVRQMEDELAKHWPKNPDNIYYDHFGPAFIIGSHLERHFAHNIGAGHLSINFPVGNRFVFDRGYAGIKGALHLAEDLFTAIVHED